jgi:hypothetical protein
MNEVTRILSAVGQGDSQAAEQLLPLVYQELRRLAAQRLSQEKPGQTLQATRRSVVHGAPYGAEAWQQRTCSRLGLQSTMRPRGRPWKSSQPQSN